MSAERTGPAAPHAAASPQSGWPLMGELFCPDAERDWDWEGIVAGGKLYLFCYLRDRVLRLAPFDLEA